MVAKRSIWLCSCPALSLHDMFVFESKQGFRRICVRAIENDLINLDPVKVKFFAGRISGDAELYAHVRFASEHDFHVRTIKPVITTDSIRFDLWGCVIVVIRISSGN
jgi:hypothetical protein